MKDHFPELSRKHLRLVLDGLVEAEATCRVQLDTAQAELKAVQTKIDRVDETIHARRRARMLAENKAKRKEREQQP